MNRNRLLPILMPVFLAALPSANAVEMPTGFRVQNGDATLGAKSFRPLKTVPEYVANVVPAGGKTKYYGELEIPVGSAAPSTLRVHFYEWQLKTPPGLQPVGRCAVNLYLQRKRGNTFHLVSSIKDVPGQFFQSGVDKSFGYPVTFVNLMWLNNQTKTIPIVRLCFQEPLGFYGPMGRNLMLTFAKGLDQKPSAQNFENYSSHFDFVDWYFDGKDANGNRQLIKLIDPLGEGGDRYVRWTWNEKEWMFQPEIGADGRF